MLYEVITGLARHPEGLELVRIGEPMRPEFAAWRYGDQFGRRRRNAVLIGTGVAAAALGLTAGMAALGAGAAVMTNSGSFFNAWFNGRTLVKVRTGDLASGGGAVLDGAADLAIGDSAAVTNEHLRGASRRTLLRVVWG